MNCPGDGFLDKMWDDSRGEFTDKFKQQIDQIADVGIDFFYLTFHAANGESDFWSSGDKSSLRTHCEIIDTSRANPFTGQMTDTCKRFFDKAIPYILSKDMKVTLYMWLRGGDSFWNWLGRDSNSINKVEQYIIPFWKTLTQYLKDKNYPYDKVILGPVFGNVGTGWGWPDYYEQEAVNWWTPIMKKVVDEIHSVDSKRIVIASPMADYGGGPTLWEDPPYGGRWLPIGPTDTVWYRVMTSKTQGGGTLAPNHPELECEADYETDPNKNENYPVDKGDIGLAWYQKEYGVTIVTEELKPFDPYIRDTFCPDWYWDQDTYDWLEDWLAKRDEMELGWMWENANCFITRIGEAFYNNDGSEKPFVDVIRDYLSSYQPATPSTPSKFPVQTVAWADGTTETIQVGDKGKIYLNGNEGKGFGFILKGSWSNQPSESVANRMLDWCEDNGVRFMSFIIDSYQSDDDITSRLNFWIPKLYDRKMFLIMWLHPQTSTKSTLLDTSTYKNKFELIVDHINGMNRKEIVVAFIGADEWDLNVRKGVTQSELQIWFDDIDPYVRNYLSTKGFDIPVSYAISGAGEDWVIDMSIEYSDLATSNSFIGSVYESAWEYHYDEKVARFSDAGKSGYQIWFPSFGYGVEDVADNSKITPDYLNYWLYRTETSLITIWYLWEGWYYAPDGEEHYMFDLNGNPYPWTENLAPYFPEYENGVVTTCPPENNIGQQDCLSGYTCCCSGTEPLPPSTEFKVGVDIYWSMTRTQFLNDYLAKMKEIGVQMVRIHMNPDYMDSLRLLIPEIRNNGIEVLGLFMNYDYAPATHGSTSTPYDTDGYGDWVYDVVNEFKQYINVWEIWNEPNLDDFFYYSGDDEGNARAYFPFLKEGYTNAKAADPTCIVLGGSLVFARTRTYNFLNAMYEEGAKNYMDHLSFHPYIDGYRSPEATGGNNPYNGPESGTIGLPAIHSLMLSHGDSRPMWITEFGYPTNDNGQIGETLQAGYLVKALEMARDWGWVETFIIYNWKDSVTQGSLTKGLLHTDRTPKPSFYAVKDFIISSVTPPQGQVYNGFSNYPYPLTTQAVDEIIDLMEKHNLNVYRMSIRPSWTEVDHPYRPELIQYYLDNTPSDWIIIIDANHLIDWGEQTFDSHLNDIKLRLRQVCTDFPDTSRVWVELFNELDTDLNGFYNRAQDLIDYVREEGFTHTLVVNKLYTSGFGWKLLDDPLDKTYQGYHGYFHSSSDRANLLNSMQTAVNMGIKIINTEVGANSNDPDTWTQSQVNALQEFTEECAQIGVGNCIWISWSTEWYYEFLDYGYDFDNPAYGG